MSGKYINVKVNVSEGQRDKIAKAIHDKTGVSIKLSHSDLRGEHVISITKKQLDQIATAYNNGKGTTLKLTKTQLMHNTKTGGFIQALLPFLAKAGTFIASTVLPNILSGALQGVGSATGSKTVDKISGNGLAFYVEKPNGQAFKAIKEVKVYI